MVIVAADSCFHQMAEARDSDSRNHYLFGSLEIAVHNYDTAYRHPLDFDKDRSLQTVQPLVCSAAVAGHDSLVAVAPDSGDSQADWAFAVPDIEPVENIAGFPRRDESLRDSGKFACLDPQIDLSALVLVHCYSGAEHTSAAHSVPGWPY
jgi:hypothetical protein